MNILLTAINAKYIHSNLAVYSLSAYAREYKKHIQIAEFTINQNMDDVLQEIYQREPDVIAFSCYIWNIEFIRTLIENLGKVLPNTNIWVGGPEVSYDAKEFLVCNPSVRGVMIGEGEKSFHALVGHYVDGGPELSRIKGLVYRRMLGEIHQSPAREIMSMDEIPFMYEGLERFLNRIIYYESSRGCPFSCSYCLSSVDKRVRFRSVELVKNELQYFLDHKVEQVKFVDRTFNCNHQHAYEIWKYITEHDNGITNFHFEISADLLNEEELQLLHTMRPGLIQLEVGVQSTNEKTITEIDRSSDLKLLDIKVKEVHMGANIHQHLDLIAGLPYEDMESFKQSFNHVYGLKPHQLQLGFLKVLKGSKMNQNAKKYGVKYRSYPPYEVLSTNWLSYSDIIKLKAVEEMVEIYYNSHQFAHTISKLEQAFDNPFEMYFKLAELIKSKYAVSQSQSRLTRLDDLREFAHSMDGVNSDLYDELLLLDLYLRENSKSRPKWAKDMLAHKPEIFEFYKAEEQAPHYLQGYGDYQYKQLVKMTHLEVFQYQVLGNLKKGRQNILFDYKRRNPLNQDAEVFVVDTLVKTETGI